MREDDTSFLGAILDEYERRKECERSHRCSMTGQEDVCASIIMQRAMEIVQRRVGQFFGRHGDQPWRYDDGRLIPVPDRLPSEPGEVLTGTLGYHACHNTYCLELVTASGSSYRLEIDGLVLERFRGLGWLPDHEHFAITATNEGNPPLLRVVFRTKREEL